jgi:hypothetical protein
MSRRKTPLLKQPSVQHKALLLLLCVWLAAMQWLGGLHSATVRIGELKPASLSFAASPGKSSAVTSLHDQLFSSLETHGSQSESQSESSHPSDTQSCAFLDAHLNADSCGFSSVLVALQQSKPSTATLGLPQRISRFLALGKQARAPPVA